MKRRDHGDRAQLSHERLERAGELLDQAVAEVDAGIEAGVPDYCRGSLQLVRAETRVAQRRISNVRKLIGTRKAG